LEAEDTLKSLIAYAFIVRPVTVFPTVIVLVYLEEESADIRVVSAVYADESDAIADVLNNIISATREIE
jgi:hypothetical protein